MRNNNIYKHLGNKSNPLSELVSISGWLAIGVAVGATIEFIVYLKAL